MEKFQERNLDTGHLFLFGEITEERIEHVMEQLVYLDGKRRGRPKEVVLWLNSTGGLLQPAMALADVFDHIKPDVRTIGVGTVESAASFILIAGTKGKRMISRYASIMLHEFAWSNSGSYTEMSSRNREIENTLKRQYEFVAKRTGKTVPEIRKVLRHEETWLTPDEAIHWSLVDAVFGG